MLVYRSKQLWLFKSLRAQLTGDIINPDHWVCESAYLDTRTGSLNIDLLLYAKSNDFGDNLTLSLRSSLLPEPITTFSGRTHVTRTPP